MKTLGQKYQEEFRTLTCEETESIGCSLNLRCKGEGGSCSQMDTMDKARNIGEAAGKKEKDSTALEDE